MYLSKKNFRYQIWLNSTFSQNSILSLNSVDCWGSVIFWQKLDFNQHRKFQAVTFDLEENHFGTKFNIIGQSAAHYTIRKIYFTFLLIEASFHWKTLKDKKKSNKENWEKIYITFLCKKLHCYFFWKWTNSNPMKMFRQVTLD